MARFVISAVAVALEKQCPQVDAAPQSAVQAEAKSVSDVPWEGETPRMATVRTATICAEYRGPRVVRGTELTLLKGDSPHPAFRPNQTLSLDVIGGKAFNPTFIVAALSLEGEKPEAPEGFWALVAFVDLKGINNIGKSKATPENVDRYLAFHAWTEYWLEEHEMLHEQTHDMTEDVWRAKDVLELILADNPLWLEFCSRYESLRVVAIA